MHIWQRAICLVLSANCPLNSCALFLCFHILTFKRLELNVIYVSGVCYGDTGSEVETEGNGMLHCRVGSLFPGRSSFHPGEPREGLAGLPSGMTISF